MDDTDLDDIRSQSMHHQTVLEGPDGMHWVDWRVAPLVVFSWQLGLHLTASCQGGDPERELHPEEKGKVPAHKMGYLLFEGWESADRLLEALGIERTITHRATNIPDPIDLCEDCHAKLTEDLPPHDLIVERHRWTHEDEERVSTSIIKFKPAALNKLVRAIP